MDPGPAVQRPPDQLRLGQGCGVAELGVMDRGQVVDRHDGGGVPGGWHDEVGAVHHVRRSDEPFHRRDVPSFPQPVQRPRRHRPLSHRDSRRQSPVDQGAPAPADGEGLEGEGRTLGQCGERPLAEGSDAGRKAEQGCGVERDAQPCPVLAGWSGDAAQVVIAPSMERIAPLT